MRNRKPEDPFDRVVRREEALRRKSTHFDSRAGVIRLAMTGFVALGVGWLVILIGHWLILAEPRWLAVLHTIVFALVVGYVAVMAGLFTRLRRQRPDWFGEL